MRDIILHVCKLPGIVKIFETKFVQQVPVTFEATVEYFLGIRFECICNTTNKVSIHLSQEAFIDHLLAEHNLHHDIINSPTTPHRPGYPVDSIPLEDYDNATQAKLAHTLQSLVGSLNWLAISTRPDIAAITNILARYCKKVSKGHITAAKRVLRYLKRN